ncbi:SprT family zinc-dependent metalloprotease [Biostraticola tofi]|nr:SprT family zinc-dependent metalloprotease [Biostraticola tofi]
MKPVRIPIALQQAVMRCLRSKLLLAETHFGREFAVPLINYQQRGTSAGTAWLEKWEIRLNPLLLIENQQMFIDEVVPHELAHLLVYRQFGRVAPHGREWRWMMSQVLHTSPSRTHNFSLDALPTKTWSYLCRCQAHSLTVRRHKRVQRGEAQYRCRHCGELLRPAERQTSQLKALPERD